MSLSKKEKRNQLALTDQMIVSDYKDITPEKERSMKGFKDFYRIYRKEFVGYRLPSMKYLLTVVFN